MLTATTHSYLSRITTEVTPTQSQPTSTTDHSTRSPVINAQPIEQVDPQRSNRQLVVNAENRQVLFRQLATLDHLPHHQRTAIESYIHQQQADALNTSAAQVVGVDIYI